MSKEAINKNLKIRTLNYINFKNKLDQDLCMVET